MGDWFQVIVDVQAGEAEVEALSAEVAGWLLSEEIVAAPGGADGYPPGRRFGTVVQPFDHPFLELVANRMHVVVGRTVFDGGQDDHGLICPHCRRLDRYHDPGTGEPSPQWIAWLSAIEQWRAGGPGRAECRHCRHVNDLNAWQWETSDWAFGQLGLRFCNWPPLRPAFVATVGRRLGHTVKFVHGKL